MGRFLGATTLFLLAWSGGCGIHQEYGVQLDIRPEPGLRGENPAEIAVLPVVNKTGAIRIQRLLPEIRRAFYFQVRDRHYTPLKLAYVDNHSILKALDPGQEPPVDQLLGEFREDAVLLITITEWDESFLRANRAVRINIEAALTSSQSRTRLWGGVASLEVRVSGRGSAGPDELDLMRGEALKVVARRVMAELPERRQAPLPEELTSD